MIVCDRSYLRELERRKKAARKAIPEEVADAIDLEIETIEAQGDAWYGVIVIGLAFRIRFVRFRIYHRKPGFQGNLPMLPVGKPPSYATWFGACSVNKDTKGYRTWVNPDDAIEALKVSHRLHRYENITNSRRGRYAQHRIDKWRIEHGINDQLI